MEREENRVVGHGGRREGAGRKPIGQKAKDATLTLRVSAELKEAMRREAEEQGVSISELLEGLFIHPTGGGSLSEHRPTANDEPVGGDASRLDKVSQ
jgi:hypothetical protein